MPYVRRPLLCADALAIRALGSSISRMRSAPSWRSPTCSAPSCAADVRGALLADALFPTQPQVDAAVGEARRRCRSRSPGRGTDRGHL
jgi:hypothetical protein